MIRLRTGLSRFSAQVPPGAPERMAGLGRKKSGGTGSNRIFQLDDVRSDFAMSLFKRVLRSEKIG